jgi:hypothetical protein
LIWTEPERFFQDRSKLAAEADAIARAVSHGLEISPSGTVTPKVRVSVEGEEKGDGLPRGYERHQRPSSHSATEASSLRDLHREKVMRLDPLLKSDRCTLVFEAVGDDKVRVNCASWDDAKVILANEALQVAVLGKTPYVTRTDRLNVELNGLAEDGHGPETPSHRCDRPGHRCDVTFLRVTGVT